MLSKFELEEKLHRAITQNNFPYSWPYGIGRLDWVAQNVDVNVKEVKLSGCFSIVWLNADNYTKEEARRHYPEHEIRIRPLMVDMTKQALQEILKEDISDWVIDTSSFHVILDDGV